MLSQVSIDSSSSLLGYELILKEFGRFLSKHLIDHVRIVEIYQVISVVPSRRSIGSLPATWFHLAGLARVVLRASVDSGSRGLDGLLNCGSVRVVKILKDIGKVLLDVSLRRICCTLLNIEL